MIEHTISSEAARRFYDRVGRRYDRFERFEGRAKARALELLDLAPGQRVLEVGVGTGWQHVLLEARIAPGGTAIGLDLSSVMLAVARERSRGPFFQADARHLPLPRAAFDRLYAGYVLDLLPLGDISPALAEFARVTRPDGYMVLLALTEGVNAPSRLLMALWKRVYALSPAACGGCRPLRLSQLTRSAGLTMLAREVVVQLGMPSEIVVATGFALAG